MALNPLDQAIDQLGPTPTIAPTAPAPKPDVFDDAINRIQSTNDVTLRQSLTKASDVAPEQAAEARRIAGKFGVPVEVAQRNLAEYQQREAAPDAGALQSDTPALGNWLTNQSNASLAQHEHDALGKVEHAVRAWTTGGYIGDLGGAVEHGYNELRGSTWNLAAAFGLADPWTAAEHAADANARMTVGKPDYVAEFEKAMAEKGKAVNAAVQSFNESAPPTVLSLQKFKAGLITVGEALDMLGAAVIRPRGLGYTSVESLPALLPMLLGGVAGGAVGAAGGPAAPVTVPVGIGAGTFLSMSPTEVGRDINARLQAKGVDVTNATDLARAYSDPALMADVRTYALKKGLTTAAVTGLVSAFGGQVARLGEGAATAGKLAAGAADVGVQAGGMGAAQVAGEAAVGEKLDVGAALNTAIGTLAFSVAHTAIGKAYGKARGGAAAAPAGEPPAGAAPEAPAAEAPTAPPGTPEEASAAVVEQAKAALRTSQGIQALADLGTAAKEAKTTSSVPDAIKALVDTAAGGDNAEAVYFNPEDWQTFWQTQGRSPADMAAAVMHDGGQAFYEAQATHAPLAVPLSDYVAGLANTEHWDGLLAHARVQPDGMTLSEAHTYLQALPGMLSDLAARAEGEPPVVEQPAPTSSTLIRDDLTAQLTAAGYGKEPSRAAAVLASSAFETIANEIGVKPEDLYRSYIGPNAVQREAGAAPIGNIPAGNIPAQVGAEPADVNAPINAMSNIGAAALRMLRENPDIYSEARKMRERAQAAGRIPEPPREAKSATIGAPNVEAAGAATGEHAGSPAGEQPAAHPVGSAEAGGHGARAERGRLPSLIDVAAADAEVPFQRASKEEDAARLTPDVVNELTRIRDELHEFPFTERTWTWLSNDAGPNDGNAAGGHANIVGGAAGAPVYDDVLQFAPLSKSSTGEGVAKMVRGTRAAVEAAIDKTLESGRIWNNLAEGAVRVAERRAANDYRDIERPALPPHWGTEAPDAMVNELSDAIDTSLEGADVSFNPNEFNQGLFDQPAPAAASGTIRLSPTATSFIETDVVELAKDPAAHGLDAEEARVYKLLADAVDLKKGTLTVPASAADRDALFSLLNDQSNLYDDMAEGKAPLTGTKAEARRFAKVLGELAGKISAATQADDTLDTGEQQPRLPEAGAVRDQNIATPELDVPFSLTSEASKAKKGKQTTLFQSHVTRPAYQRAIKRLVSWIDEKWRAVTTTAPAMTQEEARALLAEGHQAFADEANALALDLETSTQELIGQAMSSLPEGRLKNQLRILEPEWFAKSDNETFQQGRRGSISFSPDGQAAIRLFKNADASTVVHEFGHLFLQVMRDAAPKSERIAADLGTLQDWFEKETGSRDFGIDQHELMARGFERYLMEGKAPSDSLRGVFSRFRRWLTRIYSQVRSLNANLSPEVRNVFDRLLATDEAIKRAEESLNAAPLFDDPRAVGMTEKQAASYGKAVEAARQSAEAAMTAKMMRQIQREESAQWKTWRKGIEADVTKAVDDSPLYKAIDAIRNGSEQQEPLKLNRKAVRELEPDKAAAIIKARLTADDGIHPDVAAEALGFPSGRALVNALADAPSRADAITLATNAKLQLDHGEPMDDATIQQHAVEAVRSTQRTQLLRKELEFLITQHKGATTGILNTLLRAVPPTDEVRRQAATLIDQKPVGQLRPDLFNLAAAREGKAAREAFIKGDIGAAIEAKRREILLSEVYRAGSAARDEITKTLTGFKELRKADATIAETRNLDFVQAARAVLANYGIGSESSARRAATHLLHLKEYDPGAYDAIDETVRDAAANAQPYRNMPVKDFRAMAETVNSLWELARSAEVFEVAGERRALADVRRQVIEQVGRFSEPRALVGYKKAATQWDRFKVGALGLVARMRRVEAWASAVDNGREGITRSAIFNPINDGAVRFDQERVKAATAYAAIVQPLAGSKRFTDIEAPELGYTFGDKHRELLGALLHTGNGFEPGSNGYKLLVGRGWGDVQGDGTVDTSKWTEFVTRMQREGVLTKADYDYLQAVWDLNESLKPDAQRAHKARFGRFFDEVTAVPFTTPFGDYKGGYFPAIADPFVTPTVEDRTTAEGFIEGLNGGASMFPAVARGFTKARMARYAKPLIMDAAMVLGHLNDVLRFTYLSEPVHAVARLILHPAFKESIARYDPAAVSDLLRPYLERAASQRMAAPMQGKLGQVINAVADRVRSAGSMQLVALNMRVLAEQATHFMSAPAHSDLDATKLLAAAWRLSRQPFAMADDVHDASAFMSTRESAGIVEAHDAINRVLLDPSPTRRAFDWVGDHTTVLMRSIQHAMDLMAWQAAYDKVSEEPEMTHERAVKRADAAVREAMGSYRPQDRSAIEGGDLVITGLLNMFYGFFNTKLNVLGTEAALASRMGAARKYSRALAIYAIGFMAPAVAGALITNGMSNEPLNGKDDADAEAWARFWFESQLQFGSRMLPFVGPVALAFEGAFTKKEPRDILSAPAITMVQDALHAPGEEYRALTGPETAGGKAKRIADIWTLLGMLGHLPLRPIGQAYNAITAPPKKVKPHRVGRAGFRHQEGG